jgi:hypothetical protein
VTISASASETHSPLVASIVNSPLSVWTTAVSATYSVCYDRDRRTFLLVRQKL